MAIKKQYSVIMAFMLLAASFLLIWIPQVSAAVPTTTLTLSGPEYGSSPTYVNDLTTFSLSTTSSSDSIWYKWDSDSYVPYSSSFNAVLIDYNPDGPPSFSIELVGLHTLYFNATSDTGEQEAPKSLEIYVDSLPPSTSVTFSGTHYENSLNYITSDTNIAMAAVDSDCGVDKIYYAIGDGSDIEYSGPFSISESGAITLNYYAVDFLGNLENSKPLELFLDNANPTLIVDIGQPRKTIDGVIYANEDSDFVISTLDDSGISLIRYNVDGGSWITYTNSFYLTQNGNHVLNIESVDNLEHSSTETLTLYLDNSPPDITASLSDNCVVEYGTLLYLNATDDDIPGSECKISYSIDDGTTWLVYEYPIFLQESGNISYRAENILGDASTIETMKITVNSEDNVTVYLGIGLMIAGIAIIVLVFINWRFMGKEKESELVEKDSKPKKKDSKSDEKNSKPDKKRKSKR